MPIKSSIVVTLSQRQFWQQNRGFIPVLFVRAKAYLFLHFYRPLKQTVIEKNNY
jgi:hypothetical protein